MYTSENEKQAVCAEICESIINELFPSVNAKSAKALKKILAKKLSNVKTICSRAERFSEKNSDLSAPFLWLCDNFSFIEEEFLQSFDELRKAKGRTDKSGLPLSYSAVLKLCRLTQGIIDTDATNALIEAFDNTIDGGFDFTDRIYFSLFAKCALLTYIGEISENLSEKNGVFVENKNSSGLINAIKSLKRMSIHNFSKSFSLTKLERILANDPSGAYKNMDDTSKFELRRLLHIEAAKKRLSDTEYAKKLLNKAIEAGRSPQNYIGYDVGKHSSLNTFFFPSLYTISAIISFSLSYFTSLFLFPLLFFPIVEAVKPIMEAICAKFAKNTGFVPAIKISEIPDDAKTLCVITSLLRGEKFDSELYNKLERIYNANSGKNIKFGLLCDLPDCISSTSAADESILSYACGRIDSLNAKYGNNFILFIRPRSYSKSECCFMAYERKRGAVIELTKLIKIGSSSFDTNIKSVSDNRDFLKNVKYVITLDSDTNLGIDTVKELVGKMIHPKNKPIIDKEKHSVVSGYGIMQPKMSTELSGARKTPFSRLMCDSGGMDIYSGASFEIYQSLFGEGIFCGKGIFDVEAFYETIIESGIFPDDCILSHDILEGEKLRTALLCDIELTDGFPKNELSYLKRKHRWIRGDIQNIRFMHKKYRYSPLSKYKLFDNVRRVFTPAFSLFLILLSPFFPESYSAILFFAALSPYIMPFLIDAVNTVLNLAIKSTARKFFSKGVTVGIWQSFLRMLFFEAMLAKDALMSLSASATSIYRMCISKRKLLEWVTAAQSDSGSSDASVFITKHIISSVLGAFLFVFSPSGLIKTAGFAFFIMPFLAYFTSKNRKQKKQNNDKEILKLKSYAADIWNFFSENVNQNENFLPPDNIQLAPHEKIAHRTSPTNIGLYLVSTLCARDLGMINTEEFYNRITKTVETLEKMEKWKGHFFNWYNTKNLSVLTPRYVSSVDSGNFIACLITLKNGIYDYTSQKPELIETAKKISDIIENTDFSVLYNKERDLFYIGVNITDSPIYDKSCYDLYMSESRILSYYSTSSRIVPKSHFKKLARPLITAKGFIGLSSWSGTAFEYFMPALFMPFKKGSLLYEAMLFAYKAQVSRKIGKEKVWGISESGYFAFDCDLNYQYRAFGVPILSRTNENRKEAVISPYSSFLSLCVSVKGVYKNLANLEKMGMYGKYGFFEALDFTKSRVKNSRAIVKSYMSHHLGMSLLAITNVVKGEIVRKRFMMDAVMACGKELLEEKIPVNAVIKKLTNTDKPYVNHKKEVPTEKITSDNFSFKAPLCTCLSDGKSSCIISDCGHISISKGDTLLNLSSFEKNLHETPQTLMCHLKIDGRIIGLTPLSKLPDKDCKFSFAYGEGFAKHSVSCEKGDFSLSYTVSPQNFSPVRIKLSGKTSAKKIRLSFSFIPCMNKRIAYESHPAFSELFVEADFDKNEKILYYKKRPRTQNEEEIVLAIAFADENCDISFSTRRKYDMQNAIYYDPYLLFDERDNKTGACINPFCNIGTDLNGNCNSELIIVMTHSVDTAKEAILKARKRNFDSAKKALTDASSQFTIGAGISSLGSCGTVSDMLSDIVFGKDADIKICSSLQKFFSETPPDISINSLWKHGISGDYPIITIDVGNYFFPIPLEKRIRAFRLLTMKNVRCDLVILYSEADKYNRYTEKRLHSLILSCGASGYIGRSKGGIHLIDKSTLYDDIYAIKYKSCSFTETYSDNLLKRKKKESKNAVLPVISGKNCDIPQTGFKVNTGFFEGDFFCVDKTKDIKAPMAHILSGENISSVVTQDSLGYTFYKNASERRITPWVKDGNSSFEGEKLFLSVNGVFFDLAKCSSYVKYFEGKAQYFGKAANANYKVTISCAVKLPVKEIKIEINGNNIENAFLLYCIRPCMGRFDTKNIVSQKDDNTVLFSNPLSESFGNYKGFLKVFSNSKCFSSLATENIFLNEKSDDKTRFSNSVCTGCYVKSGKNICTFVLGAEKNSSIIEELTERAFKNDSSSIEIQAEDFKTKLIPDIIFTPSKQNCEAKSFEVMFNRFMPYSCIFSRILARSGYYQSGGAYGFRDQLQDCLLLIYSDKKRALTHICRAAAHQFLKGDVLHWWHTQGKKGVRTTCSDDYLWLVYAVCEYAKAVGDYSFLDISVPYIEGEELSQSENERYITFKNSNTKENLYSHAVRCLDRACSLLGEHGLCLMGCCDWCDGYSSVGKDGYGESTFTTMFLIMNLKSFSEICSKRNDPERKFAYESIAQKLRDNLIKHAFDSKNGYFIRGYYDDMSPLGSIDCSEGNIDLMAQCMAPLCNIPTEISKKAIDSAYNNLFDKEYGIMKLLSPAFDKTKKEPGYIKGYLPGVRENGGQYTHGALFFALGCFTLSDELFEKNLKASEKYASIGAQILKYSNPAYRSSDGVQSNIKNSYITEPYSVAADIYSTRSHIGRGGWTHYTGAAGWFYRLILKYVLGIEAFDTDTEKPYILINTKRVFPMDDITDGATVKFSEFGFDLSIRYIKDGKKRVTSSGNIINDGKIFRETKKIEVHI